LDLVPKERRKQIPISAILRGGAKILKNSLNNRTPSFRVGGKVVL
jgi:hypothetical protein